MIQKGPWREERGQVVDSDGRQIQLNGVALSLGRRDPRGTPACNTRLVAAAPELLELLRQATAKLASWQALVLYKDEDYALLRDKIEAITSLVYPQPVRPADTVPAECPRASWGTNRKLAGMKHADRSGQSPAGKDAYYHCDACGLELNGLEVGYVAAGRNLANGEHAPCPKCGSENSVDRNEEDEC